MGRDGSRGPGRIEEGRRRENVKMNIWRLKGGRRTAGGQVRSANEERRG